MFDGMSLGRLRTTEDGKYELVVGNHVLEGFSQDLKRPLVVFYPTEEVEAHTETEGHRSHVCRAQGIIRRKILFKSRPRIVLGALGEDSELDKDTTMVDREMRRS